MTISNGSTIEAADLNALLTSSLELVQADNGQLPGAYELHLQFPGVVASTDPSRRKFTFVVPFDCFLETFALSGADQTAASSISGAITGDGTLVDDLSNSESITDEGKLVFWPHKRSGAGGSGLTKATRLLFDGTRTKPGRAFAIYARAHRTFLQGSTITVSVASSGIATASNVCVALVLREFFARE